MAAIRLSRIRTEERPLTGVSLEGPSSVDKGTSGVYTITDYDVFSIYTVTATVGTATIDRDKITLIIPSTAIASQTTLDVSMNGVVRSLAISLKTGNIIAQPAITSPVNGITGVSNNLTLQSTGFASLPAGSLTHTATEWTIARDSIFSDIVISKVISSGNLSSLTASLSTNTIYYARVRYISNSVVSDWSPTVSFTTTTIYIQKPVISAQNGQATNISTDLALVGTAFEAVPANTDTHISSTWVVREKTTDAIAYQLENSTSNKLSVTVPASSLEVSKEYSVQLKYTGQIAESAFSDKFTFTTSSSLIPSQPGTPFGGGYYVGRINIGGIIYALIVSPKAGGERQISFLDSTSVSLGGLVASLNDGLTNTNAILSRAGGRSPMASWARSLSIGGFTDWYIPSVDELEMCYRYLKPNSNGNVITSSTSPRQSGSYPSPNNGYNPSSIPIGPLYTSGSPSMTKVTNFQQGQSQSFITDILRNEYWTSSCAGLWERSGNFYESTYRQNFNDGTQGRSIQATGNMARAVRRVRIN